MAKKKTVQSNELPAKGTESTLPEESTPPEETAPESAHSPYDPSHWKDYQPDAIDPLSYREGFEEGRRVERKAMRERLRRQLSLDDQAAQHPLTPRALNYLMSFDPPLDVAIPKDIRSNALFHLVLELLSFGPDEKEQFMDFYLNYLAGPILASLRQPRPAFVRRLLRTHDKIKNFKKQWEWHVYHAYQDLKDCDSENLYEDVRAEAERTYRLDRNQQGTLEKKYYRKVLQKLGLGRLIPQAPPKRKE